MNALLRLGALLAVSCSSAQASGGPLEVTVDTSAPSRAISPYIYGVNGIQPTENMEGIVTLVRFGGTRVSTYNWENNASNAGHDPPANQNDGYLSPSVEPGAAVVALLDRARQIGAAALVTVPMIGYVAADRRADGDVIRSRNYRETRFRRSLARGGRAPRLDDPIVHQDAFVRFVRDAARERGVRVFFALDNEPGAWPVHHPRLRAGRPLTYDEILARSRDHASMIRGEAPDAKIFGPVSFGWPDMTTLARAPDANGRHFLTFYLQGMRARGRSLLDVLDVHWYPDVRVDGRRVASSEDHAALARMRMQLPRSLYDDSFVEPSFIAEDLDGPIRLLPRLSALARQHLRGTRVAITEYAYGGAARPSGAVAQADVLGAFGHHGVFAAAYWPLFDQRHDYALAAFRMFRRIDGDTDFGDRSIPAVSSDLSRLSAWASLDSRHPGRVVIVLVGRSERHETARLTVRGNTTPARRFLLDVEAPRPREAGTIDASAGGVYRVPVPPRSVTTLIIDPAR